MPVSVQEQEQVPSASVASSRREMMCAQGKGRQFECELSGA